MQICSEKIAKMNGMDSAIEKLQGVIANFKQYTEQQLEGNADFPFLYTDKYKAADCTYTDTEGNTSFNVTFPSLLHINASGKYGNATATGITPGNIIEDLQSFIKELDKENFVVVISLHRFGEKHGTRVQFKFENADIAKRLFLLAEERVHGQPGFAIDGARNVHNVLFTNNTTRDKIKALVKISSYLDEERKSILINREIKEYAKNEYQKKKKVFTDELFLGVLQKWLDKLKEERLKLEEKEAANIVVYAKSSRNSVNSDTDLEDAQDVIASIKEFAERLDDLTENTQAIQDAKVTIKKYLQEVTQIMKVASANTNASFVDKAQ